LISAVDRVEQLKEQLNDACLDVHKILYLKDKKQVLQLAMNASGGQVDGAVPAGAGGRGAARGGDLPLQIYRSRLRSLDACEKRAAKCREEIEIEKNEAESAKRQGLEALKQQQLEQHKSQVAALEMKILTRNRTISRLQGLHLSSPPHLLSVSLSLSLSLSSANARMIDRDIVDTLLQSKTIRSQMAITMLHGGSYDMRLKIENDALTCSLLGLQETYQCIHDQIEVEEQARQKENKQLELLQTKIRETS
jgi:hypothetical protein